MAEVIGNDVIDVLDAGGEDLEHRHLSIVINSPSAAVNPQEFPSTNESLQNANLIDS